MSMLANLNSIILLLTVVINLGLGLFVYLKDQKNEANRSFSYMLFAIAFWSLSFLFFANAKASDSILFWRRFTPAGSALIAGYFLYFSLVFPGRKIPLSSLQRGLLLLPGYVFAVLSVFTPFLIKTFSVENLAQPFQGVFHFGKPYYFYALYLLFYFSLALFNLTRKFLMSQGKEKLQLFYVLTGMGFSVVLGMAVSLFLPLLGIAQLFVLGPPFTLIMVGFVTYAIIRHRLLNIEDFFANGGIVLFLSFLGFGTFWLVFTNYVGFLPAFYVISAHLTLAIIVVVKNRKSEAAHFFWLLTACIAFWVFSAYMVRMREAEGLMFWDRFIFVWAILIPTFFLYFTFTFPRIRWNFSFFSRLLLFLPAALFLIFNQFGLIIQTVSLTPHGATPLFGAAYPFFAAYFLFYIGWGLLNLIKKYRISVGTEKTQIGYVFLGLFFTFSAAMVTNLILPGLGELRFFDLGAFFTLFVVGFTSYAIVKHRLMSIEVVIQRSSVYGAATLLILALYALVVIISETFFRNLLGYSSLLVTASAALLIAVLYQPLVKYFQYLTDRLFFRGRYDYQKTISEVSHKIAAVIRLEELTRLLVSSFVDTMKVSEISFLLPEKEKEHFLSVSLSVPRYKKIEIDVSSPIVSWLSAAKDMLVREELEDEIGRQEALGKEGAEKKKQLEEVRDEIERLGISVWVPIISKDEIIGVIALGNKLSGDIFSTEDLALIATLANQAAVALDNARLYDEVVSMKNYSEEILQSMTNGVLTADNRERITTYNYMAEQITGRKFNEVIGKKCEEIWGQKGAITTAIENTLKGSACINFETALASPERGLVPVTFSSTLLRDSQGKKMGALLSIHDLSEMKELEDKVRRADKLTALATMAAGMAHEIKNPLSSMKVFSQLLPKRFDDPQFRQKLQEILPKEIDRIDRIVESLLGFARATAPTFENTKIEQVIDETLNYFEEQAKNAGVKINKNYAQLPEIEVDRSQISQVFSNLVLNGIQAMLGGGEISITTLPGKKADGILQNIKIQVSDTGHGISEEMQKKLFDPFFTTKYGGTGLGLTITHSIVDGHKGFIDVESQPGKGTTFTVTLPVNQKLV